MDPRLLRDRGMPDQSGHYTEEIMMSRSIYPLIPLRDMDADDTTEEEAKKFARRFFNGRWHDMDPDRARDKSQDNEISDRQDLNWRPIDD